MNESARMYTTDTISHNENFLLPFKNAAMIPNKRIINEMKPIMEKT